MLRNRTLAYDGMSTLAFGPVDLFDRIRLYSSLALAFLLFVQAAFWFAIAVRHLWYGALLAAGLPMAIAAVLGAAAAFFWWWGLAARR